MLKKAPNKVKIAGINLSSTSEEGVLVKIRRRMALRRRTFIVTPNPEFVVFAQKNPWFRDILNQADLAIPDGMGLIWAGKLLGRPIKERVAGIDLTEKLCQEAAKEGWTVFLFGGRPGVAKKAFLALKEKYPGLKGWVNSGPKKGKPIDDQAWAKKINEVKPDLLFVALGMGKQEKFISDNWKDLKVKLAMGVGGSFDFLSGKAKRAPEWVQKAGLEWAYRLKREPWRFKRQLSLLQFVKLVLQERLTR